MGMQRLCLSNPEGVMFSEKREGDPFPDPPEKQQHPAQAEALQAGGAL